MLEGEFIPNPCDHVMFDHLRFQLSRVTTRSSAGERAEKTLMFNDEESVKFREFVLGMIELTEQKKIRLQDTLTKIEEQSLAHPNQNTMLTNEKMSVEAELAKIDDYLRRLGAA